MIESQVFWLNPSMSKNDYVVSIKAIKISTGKCMAYIHSSKH